MKKISKCILFLISALMIGVVIQSCKSTSKVVPPSGNPPADISGSWVLTAFKGQPALDLFKTKLPVLHIDQYDKTVSGNSGCNSVSGTFTFENGVFTASRLASTLMACPELSLEDEYVKMLEQGSIIKISNGIMSFVQDGKTVAKFQKGVDQTLLYGNWTLTTLYGEDAGTYFKTEKKPTIEFSVQEQRLGGFAGCNRYNSTYVIEGESITVGPIVTTRMACPDMDGETKFIQALSDTSTMSATRQTITFSKDGKVVAEFARN